MNYLHLAKAAIGFYFFMKRHTAHYGEPVDLTEEECEKVYADMRADSFSKYRFSLAMDIRTLKFTFLHNIEKFLPYKNNFTIDAYFRAIHPDYLVEYIQWAETIYRYTTADLSMRPLFQPLKQNYRITIPMKLLDGKYHWMLMDCLPLQFDKNNNLISHLNTYLMVRPFIEGEKTPLIGTLYDDNFEEAEWNNTLWKMFYFNQPFILTPEQNKIVEVLLHNSDFSNFEIAEKLNKKKNTIDVQNKQILERARESFKNEKFENVREVVLFLKSLQFFGDDYFTTHPSW